MLESENGIVFARCRLCRPHGVRSREGKVESKTRRTLRFSANCSIRHLSNDFTTAAVNVTAESTDGS